VSRSETSKIIFSEGLWKRKKKGVPGELGRTKGGAPEGQEGSAKKMPCHKNEKGGEIVPRAKQGIYLHGKARVSGSVQGWGGSVGGRHEWSGGNISSTEGKIKGTSGAY